MAGQESYSWRAWYFSCGPMHPRSSTRMYILSRSCST
ncbi:hypothetical protein MTR67_027392 [Solanum verrucosum]|uniref:Uncharacterized protein n=1 Tax=Solanum verrucosum TaxID=315347 RepID=A0AAF0R4Z2_SOLVR|nr:hypothetical protein MTR67_027392 [Solanum verrucosum]